VVAKNGYAGYPVGTARQTIMASLIILVGTARPTVSLNTRDSFGGAPKNKLLVAEYSGGMISALAPGTGSNIPRGNVSQVISGLTDPLDLIEGHQKNKGNLYVAELISGGTSGQISLLKASS